MEFKGDDRVYMKVSPMKGFVRLCRKGKIHPRHIAKRIGNVAYELELSQELTTIHPLFRILMFKKCMGDPLLIVSTENVGIKDILSYEEISIQILDRQFRKFRTKEIALVKILWRKQFFETLLRKLKRI